MQNYDGDAGLGDLSLKPMLKGRGVWLAAGVAFIAAFGAVFYVLSFRDSGVPVAERPSSHINAAPASNVTPVAVAHNPKS